MKVRAVIEVTHVHHYRGVGVPQTVVSYSGLKPEACLWRYTPGASETSGGS